MNKDQLRTSVAAEVDHRIAEFAEGITMQEKRLVLPLMQLVQPLPQLGQSKSGRSAWVLGKQP